KRGEGSRVAVDAERSGVLRRGTRPQNGTVDARSAGFAIVIVGFVVVAVGLLAMTGALSWVGRLPGDIRYESGNTRVYVPITTMVLLSVGLSVVLYVVRRFL
ncbi:MAG: DUF2905 domain-containing protein, partial [Dehalococcoidia bacterium]